MADSPCPRCGADVGFKVSGDVVCPNDRCSSIWTTKKAYDHEVVARGLTGTKKKKYGKAYINGEGEGSIKDELGELVALTAYTTLQNVYEAIDMSIKGREHMITQGSSAKEIRAEIKALTNMQEWIRIEMDQYGDPK